MHIEQLPKPTHGTLSWQQLRHRNEQDKCVVGASEVATVMGCNDYESIADIAIRKLLPPQTTETNEAMMRGNILEPALLQYAQNMLDTPIITPDVMYRNGQIIATLDGRGAEQTDLIVEVKTNNHWALGNALPLQWQWQGVQEPGWAAVLCLGPLAPLALAHILCDVNVLTHPEG